MRHAIKFLNATFFLLLTAAIVIGFSSTVDAAE